MRLCLWAWPDIQHVRAGKYHEGAKPWQVVESVDIALPCATQNEIEESDIDALKQAGCVVLAEGANMALASGAVEAVHKAGIEYGPAKAANAGAHRFANSCIHDVWVRRFEGCLGNATAPLYEQAAQCEERLLCIATMGASLPTGHVRVQAASQSAALR